MTMTARTLRALRAAAAAFGSRIPAPGEAGRDEYEDFLKERDAKLSLSEKQGEFLDKSLLTLSGGALGLFLTFLHDHGPDTRLSWLSIVGLGALAASVLAVLGSVSASQRSISKHIDALDHWCEEGFPTPRPLQGNLWVGATKWLNRCAIILFAIGVIAMASFVGNNLQSSRTNSNGKADTQAECGNSN